MTALRLIILSINENASDICNPLWYTHERKSMKKKSSGFKKFFYINSAAFAGLYLINRSISLSVPKSTLKLEDGGYYRWKYGKVFYTITGSGSKPLLLIHDANEYGSAEEWHFLAKNLAADYRIWLLDLPGCGRSDKPAYTYTNYFYTLLVSSFIRDVIREKADVCASGLSSTFPLMASLEAPDQIGNIYMISPCSLKLLQNTPDERSVVLRILSQIPVIGTTIYHLSTIRPNIEYLLKEKYFYNPFQVPAGMMEACYEASHLSKGKGKYLLASLRGGYLYWDIRRALKQTSSPITIINGEKTEHAAGIAEAYRKYNASIRVCSVSNAKLLPHMEMPAQTANIILSE